MHYGFGIRYVSQQATQGSWHSGHSPYRYELIELPSKVKKCHDCGLGFSEKFRQPPHNIVLRLRGGKRPCNLWRLSSLIPLNRRSVSHRRR